MLSLADLRASFGQREDCIFVSADEYLTRLTDRTPYERCDEPAANLLGLKHAATGRRYLICVEELPESIMQDSLRGRHAKIGAVG